MSDLISRQAAIEKATKEHDFFSGATTPTDKARRDELLNVICWLGELPSAQPKKGKWIDMGDDYVLRWKCSECKKRYHFIFNYCPDCGAYMRTEDGEWA